MKFDRRSFIKSGLGVGALAAAQGCLSAAGSGKTSLARLEKAAATPVLKLSSINAPVKIASIELLRDKRNYFVRTTSADGAVGIAVTNQWLR